MARYVPTLKLHQNEPEVEPKETQSGTLVLQERTSRLLVDEDNGPEHEKGLQHSVNRSLLDRLP